MLTLASLRSALGLRAARGPAAAAVPLGARPRCVRVVAGCDVCPGLAYHPAHVWARPAGEGRFAVGIDDFAARLLGDVTRVRLPAVGSVVEQGGRAARLRAGPRAADVVSAAGGEVVAVNGRLAADPGLAGRDPYGGGWMFVVRPAAGTEPERQLLTGALVEAWTAGDCDELEALLDGPDGWATLRDGGSAADRAARLDPAAWRALACRFLRT